MKKIYSIIFLLFIGITVKATHISYTDITYKSLGGLSYEFTLTMYKDCGGAAAPSIMSISVCSPSSGSAPSISLPQVPGTGLPIFPICSHPLSVCVGGTDIGFQKYVYKVNYTFPSAKSDWTLTHNYCCRVSYITNIVSPLLTGTGIKFVIDNLNYPGNSSPTFNDEPVLFACCNQSFSYNQSATDIDGDSLVYSLYYPYNDNVTCTAGSTVTYNGSFTYLQPVTSSPIMSMNPASGYLTIYPTACTEVSVMGIRVDEYRGKLLAGSIFRDNMIMVTNEVATGKEEKIEDENISVYPNPFNSSVNVSGVEKGLTIDVFNVLGNKLISELSKSSAIDLNLSKFENGTYFIKISSDEGFVIKRIIKQ